MALAAFGSSDNEKHRDHGTNADVDRDLVQRCQRGDRRAQFELYQRYKDWVFNIAFRMANHQQEAEDITQKVFLRLFTKLDSFRGDSAFSSWLYRMAVNVCINHFNKEKTRRRHTAAQQLDGLQHGGKPAGRTDAGLPLKPHLEAAIRALPPGYRAVFVLYDVEGYSHQEISEMLGVSVGTCKSQLHKARKELRQMLAPYLTLETL